jgi:hypothetical protein
MVKDKFIKFFKSFIWSFKHYQDDEKIDLTAKQFNDYVFVWFLFGGLIMLFLVAFISI